MQNYYAAIGRRVEEIWQAAFETEKAVNGPAFLP
jgi:hypothetical protein